jgi:hypothetical protein
MGSPAASKAIWPLPHVAKLVRNQPHVSGGAFIGWLISREEQSQRPCRVIEKGFGHFVMLGLFVGAARDAGAAHRVMPRIRECHGDGPVRSFGFVENGEVIVAEARVEQCQERLAMRQFVQPRLDQADRTR